MTMSSSLTPPSSFSSSPDNEDALPRLQERLQLFVQKRPEQWAYTIFWRKGCDANGGVVLAWGDGHFKGTKVAVPFHDQFGVGLKRKTTLEGDESLEDLSDMEWFYMVSLTQSFAIDDDLLGKVYSTRNSAWLNGIQKLQECSFGRAKEAHMHGIQTLVCIPTSCGVLELGSSELIKKNLGLLQQAETLFGSEVTALVLKQSSSPGNLLPILDPVIFSFADTGIPAGVHKKNEQQHEAAEIQMEFSTTDEKKKPEKRGRKPRIGREYVPVNNVMAERQRREKFNHLFNRLRAVVPNVSGMGRETVLEAAVSYINELNAKINELETAQVRMSSKKIKIPKLNDEDIHQQYCSIDNHYSESHSDSKRIQITDVEVKIIGQDAMIRVRCESINHPSARLMAALRDLKFVVVHMSVWRVEEVMIQHVLVRLPKELGTEERVKAALISRLFF